VAVVDSIDGEKRWRTRRRRQTGNDDVLVNFSVIRIDVDDEQSDVLERHSDSLATVALLGATFAAKDGNAMAIFCAANQSLDSILKFSGRDEPAIVYATALVVKPWIRGTPSQGVSKTCIDDALFGQLCSEFISAKLGRVIGYRRASNIAQILNRSKVKGFD
jgi:hypothetical protein